MNEWMNEMNFPSQIFFSNINHGDIEESSYIAE